MDVTTESLIIETWTYLGRRLTQSDAIRYVWLHEQAPDGENHYQHHKQVVANAAVGSRWDFRVQGDGSYFVKGENRPQFREQLAGDKVIQWDIRDKGAAATKQMLANAKSTCACGGHWKGDQNHRLVKVYSNALSNRKVEIPTDDKLFEDGVFNGDGSY